MYVDIHAHVCPWEPEVDVRCLFSVVLHQGLLFNRGLINTVRLTGQSTSRIHLSLSPNIALGLQVCTDIPDFLCGCEDLNSSPHISTLSPLSTEPPL